MTLPLVTSLLAAALVTTAPGARAAAAPAAAAPAAAPSPAASPALVQPGRNRPDLMPAPSGAHAGDDTRCDRCHTTESWSDVSFAHERTGFPLKGAHARTGCKSCHGVSFTQALGQTCLSCHRDVHQGRLSARCQSCHDEESWKTRFDADAHRRGNFPLTGRHAFLPCEECHGDRRDRGFVRQTPQCLDCHRGDLARTAGSAVDHGAPGFSTRCQDCHTPWRFQGASFAAHEACFQLSGGPHAGIRCLSCHTALTGFATTGACNTATAACTRCHACNDHPNEPGFACAERKCYECHRFIAGGLGLSRGQLRRKP